MLGILAVLIGLTVTIYLVQRQFIYFPTKQDLHQAEREATQRGLEPWLHEGQFIGWQAPYPDGKATGSILVLHGNAGAAIHRTYFRDLFQSPALDARFDVYLLEYPGFGPRPGSPSEASLLQAAAEAITQLQQDSPKPILLVGESLGTVVASIGQFPTARCRAGNAPSHAIPQFSRIGTATLPLAAGLVPARQI